MDAYRQMELHKDELTPRELGVYEAIVANDELVRGSSSTELAKALGVSQSVISRFCQKIGFSGYGDFRMSLYQTVGKLEGRGEKGGERDVADYYSDAVYEVRRSLPDSLLERLSRTVLDARDVYISGFGGSATPAALLGTLLTQDSVRAHVLAPGDETGALHFTSDEDLFILFSLMNPTHESFVSTVHELSPKRRPHVIMVTGTAAHPLRREVDEVISLPVWTSKRGSVYLNPAFGTMLFCMLLSRAVSEAVNAE